MKSTKFLLLIILALSILIGLMLFYYLTSKIPPTTQASISEQQKITEFKQVNAKFKSEIPLATINKYYDLVTPNKMLDVIEEDTYCHMKGHNIGRAIYQKTQDIEQSMQLCSNRCSSGCAHGILMEVFKNQAVQGKQLTDEHISLEQVKNSIDTICNEAVNSGKMHLEGCAHGIGHALMSMSEDDIKTSLPFCDNFDNQSATFFCATGVFMQGSLDRNQTKPQSTVDFSCSDFNFPAACYRYKLYQIFPGERYPEAKQYCSQIKDQKEQYGCFNGIGFTYYKLIQSKKLSLETLCQDNDLKNTQMCVEGVIEVIKAYDRNRATEICQQQKGQNKNTCNDVLNNGWLPKEISSN